MAHSSFFFCLSGEQAKFYKNGAAHFEIQDWEGTERVQTSYNGAVEGTYRSLPYGDGYSASGTDDDAYHFAMLDQDNSSDDHAIFREYSNMTGRWMSPDPYYGSYNLNNPQSFNRYAYVLNSPLSYIDPWGLQDTKVSVPIVINGCLYIRTTTDQNGDVSTTDTFLGCPSAPTTNQQSPGSGSIGGGAPNNTRTTCIAAALGSGALSAGVDALGFIPGEKDVQAAVDIGSGTFARQIGNWNGHRGIVADRFGARFIARGSQYAGAFGSGATLGTAVGTGDWISLGLSSAGLIPGLNEFAAGASIVYDGVKTAEAVAKCH